MSIKKYTDKISKMLDLNRQVIGVKFENKREDYEIHTARGLLKPIPYCVAVKSAMAGHRVKIDCFTSGCSGGSRALGLTPATHDYFNGERIVDMGLCKSMQLGAHIAQEVPTWETDTTGVIIQPLEYFEEDPDVVLITGTARNIMRIVQGYTYQFGIAKNIILSGNQAVCMESTVNAYRNNGMNVSVLCSGTRYEANWNDDELMVGISFKKFVEVVKGIEQTINPVESDENKLLIEKALATTNNLEIDVEYGKAYYMKK